MKTSKELEGLPTIKMIDPLAKALGAVSDGIVDYTYMDCVKLAGHSCPTVGSTFLATQLALKILFPDMLPIRGTIKVYFSGDKSEGVNGVMANVASLITGASDEGGFKGLAGRFSRNERVFFNQNDVKGAIAFERMNTGTRVDVKIDLSTLESSPQMGELMQKMMSQSASEQEVVEFGELWQKKVRRLFDNASNHITIVS